jgi:hypothetical protein
VACAGPPARVSRTFVSSITGVRARRPTVGLRVRVAVARGMRIRMSFIRSRTGWPARLGGTRPRLRCGEGWLPAALVDRIRLVLGENHVAHVPSPKRSGITDPYVVQPALPRAGDEAENEGVLAPFGIDASL